MKTKWLSKKDADLYGFHGPYHNGRSAVEHYNEKIIARREKYKPKEPRTILDFEEEFRFTGHHKIDNFFNDTEKGELLKIRDTIERFTDEDINIKKRDANMAFINQPILNIPELYKFVFDERLIQVATSYYGCIPALSSVAVRRSYITDSPPVTNQFFHRDYNGLVKIVKVIIYLNDVDESGGPFTYVSKSAGKMFDNWWRYHYLDDSIIQKYYDPEDILPLTANFGDVLFAGTRGWHKGAKPKNKERYAIHACFLIHPELTGPGHQKESTKDNWYQIREQDYHNIPEHLRPAADFLIKV